MSESPRAVWLITGAAGALGQALVRYVLAAGHDCIALDRNERGLNELHDELEQAGQGVPALVPMDLAGAAPEDYQRLADTIEERFGRIDVLVHNAASFRALRPLLHQQPGEWLEIIQTSVTAPYLLSTVLAPIMPGDERGQVVMINDRHCLEKPGNWGAYGVAQAGREQMARSLAAERVPGAPHVLALDPGPFFSPLRVAAWPSDSPENLPSAEAAAERIMEAIKQASTSQREEK